MRQVQWEGGPRLEAFTATLPSMRLRLAGVAALVGLASLSSCTSTGTKESEARTAAVYTAILRSVLPPDEAESDVIWVAPFPDRKSVELETQASVINDLSNQATVRFVDELSEATTDDPGAPVKEGFVVVLGSVPSTGNTVNVPGELYRSEDDRMPALFRVTATTDEQWQAQSVPVPTTTTSA